MSPISRIASIQPIEVPAAAPAISRAPGQENGFSDVLRSALDRVETSRTSANEAVQQFLAGNDSELHGAILKTQRAELEFEYFLQVRNKVVQAYQEMMRMQI